jgi:hypothetical protein
LGREIEETMEEYRKRRQVTRTRYLCIQAHAHMIPCLLYARTLSNTCILVAAAVATDAVVTLPSRELRNSARLQAQRVLPSFGSSET